MFVKILILKVRIVLIQLLLSLRACHSHLMKGYITDGCENRIARKLDVCEHRLGVNELCWPCRSALVSSVDIIP